MDWMETLKRRFWRHLVATPERLLSRKVTYLATVMEDLKWERRLQIVQDSSTNPIATYTTETELRNLYELAASCPQNAQALEIGSYLGASSRYIAAGLSTVNGHLYCVDTWRNEAMMENERDTFPEFVHHTRRAHAYITPLRKRSEQLEPSDIQQPLSLIFIDGDHRAEAVQRDFDCSQKLLAEDGIVAFHDFGNAEYEGVSRVVGSALAGGEWTMLGKVETLVWIQRASWQAPDRH